jgi:hypothetical protein
MYLKLCGGIRQANFITDAKVKGKAIVCPISIPKLQNQSKLLPKELTMAG